MFVYDIVQGVNKVTRVQSTSSSILYLVFISRWINDYTVTVERGISDHKRVCFGFSGQTI